MRENSKEVHALVTGAASGIGRAIAIRLAEKGYVAAVADIRSDMLNETADIIREAEGKVISVNADVSSEAEVRHMINEITSVSGGIDVLVNNAGVGSAGFIENVTDDDIERVFGVNLIGLMRVTRAAAPYLKCSERGRIINISSVEGIRGSGLLPVYSAAKAGVIGLTRANAVELARFKITVNAICPGPIQTDMLAPMLAEERFREKMIKGIPMRRLGVPEDVAGAAAFFASEEASFITGNVLVIDGGMTVKAL